MAGNTSNCAIGVEEYGLSPFVILFIFINLAVY